MNFKSRLKGAIQTLHRPVPIDILVVFRIFFGLIAAGHLWTQIAGNHISGYYTDTLHHFKFYGFEWVPELGDRAVYALFYALCIVGIAIAVGFLYRLAVTLYFLGSTYLFLIDESLYQNHYYLMCLLSFWMIFIPAHRSSSLDTYFRPHLRSDFAPAWALWLLRFQVGIVYFFGGVAKINWDWLRGEPMGMMLANNADSFPLLGQYFDERWMAYAFAYGGLFYDLLIVPFLMWRRTRLLGCILTLVFHFTNVWMFGLGIFPWFMMGSTLLFFPPTFLRRWTQEFPRYGRNVYDQACATTLRWNQIGMAALLAIGIFIQLLLPFRQYLYPGNPSWTYEGNYFAWKMKLDFRQFDVRIIARDPASGKEWTVDPFSYVTDYQWGIAPGRPGMMLQLCHWIAEDYRSRGYPDIEVRVEDWVSLNGRNPQLLIDPTVDLAAQQRSLRHASWLMPLTEPFRSPVWWSRKSPLSPHRDDRGRL